MLVRKHIQSTSVAIQASLIAIVALFSTNTDAAGAVSTESWSTVNHLNVDTSTLHTMKQTVILIIPAKAPTDKQ